MGRMGVWHLYYCSNRFRQRGSLFPLFIFFSWTDATHLTHAVRKAGETRPHWIPLSTINRELQNSSSSQQSDATCKAGPRCGRTRSRTFLSWFGGASLAVLSYCVRVFVSGLGLREWRCRHHSRKVWSLVVWAARSCSRWKGMNLPHTHISLSQCC